MEDAAHEEKLKTFVELNKNLAELYRAEVTSTKKTAFDKFKNYFKNDSKKVEELNVLLKDPNSLIGLEINYDHARMLAVEQIELIQKIKEAKKNKKVDISDFKNQYDKLEIIKEFYLGEGKKIEERAATEVSALANGPQVKNYFTYQLEDLVKGMLNGENFSAAKNENNEYVVIMNDERYNVNEILKHANFTHLSLNDHDKDNFITMLTQSRYKPGFENFNFSHIPAEEMEGMNDEEKNRHYYGILDQKFMQNIDDENKEKKDDEKDESLKELHKSERLAINLYTGTFYKTSNLALRGDLDRALETALKVGPKSKIQSSGTFSNEETSNCLKELICTSALIQHALSHVPDATSNKENEYSYRMEAALPPEILKERLTAAVNQGIIDTKGALSTKDKSPMLQPEFYSQVGMVLKGGGGKKVKALSSKKGEDEVLYPASQIRYIGALKGKKKDNFLGDSGERTVFMAERVVTVTGLSAESKLTKQEVENDNEIQLLIAKKNELKEIKKELKENGKKWRDADFQLKEVHEAINQRITAIIKDKQRAPERPNQPPPQRTFKPPELSSQKLNMGSHNDSLNFTSSKSLIFSSYRRKTPDTEKTNTHSLNNKVESSPSNLKRKR